LYGAVAATPRNFASSFLSSQLLLSRKCGNNNKQVLACPCFLIPLFHFLPPAHTATTLHSERQPEQKQKRMATVREMMARFRSPIVASRADRNKQRRQGALREMWFIPEHAEQAELAYSDDNDLEEIEEEEELEMEELEDEEKQAASLPVPKATGRPPLFPHLPLRMPLPPLHPPPGDVVHAEEEREKEGEEEEEEEDEEEEDEEEEEDALEDGTEIEDEHTYVPLTLAHVGPGVDAVLSLSQQHSPQQELEEVIVEEVEEKKERVEQRVEERLLQEGSRPATPAYDHM